MKFLLELEIPFEMVVFEFEPEISSCVDKVEFLKGTDFYHFS